MTADSCDFIVVTFIVRKLGTIICRDIDILGLIQHFSFLYILLYFLFLFKMGCSCLWSRSDMTRKSLFLTFMHVQGVFFYVRGKNFLFSSFATERGKERALS